MKESFFVASSLTSVSGALAAASCLGFAGDTLAGAPPVTLRPEPAPRLAHTPSKYVSRNHEESSGHVDLDVARGSATSMSPMGVDLSQHSGALSRKLQMHGHHAGSFTLPPKPHSPGRAGSPSGSVALSASVEAESWSATLADDTIQDALSPRRPAVRASGSVFEIRPDDVDADRKQLKAAKAQTAYRTWQVGWEIKRFKPPGPGATKTEQKPKRPPSAPLERRRRASSRKSNKGAARRRVD